MMGGSHRLKYGTKALRWLPPEMPGKARLARRLLGSCLNAQEVPIEGRDGITYVVPSLREPVGFSLLVNGVYELEAVDFVLNRLRPGATFVDIGANIGTFTLPAARKLGRTGRAIAVEPSPRVFPYLERNVELNKISNVHLVRCAALDRDGANVPFYEAPIDHFGMGSLSAQFHTEPVPVLGQTLDHILEEQRIGTVDLVKVDVEGFEYAVFKGAQNLLTSHHPPIIVFEFCDWAENRIIGVRAGEAQQVLKRWGYRMWRLKDMLHGRTALTEVLTSGFETLVAKRNSDRFSKC